MPALPFAARDLIPHREPMCLVERLIAVDGKKGSVEARLGEDCPLVAEDGSIEDVVLIELVAQAYACLKGYVDRLEQKPVRQGFLVGIKTFARLETARAGELLRIDIETLAELDDFAVAEGRIWNGTKLVGRGEIKIWIN